MNIVSRVVPFGNQDINDALTKGKSIEFIEPKGSDDNMLNKIQELAKKSGREQDTFVIDFSKEAEVSVYECTVDKMLANCNKGNQ